MKYGFEREFFVKANGKFVLCPQVMPHDECGFLAESRGEPSTDPITAAFLLLAEEFKLTAQAKRNRVKLALLNFTSLPAELLRDALRRNGKNPLPVERGNMYGNDYPAAEEPAIQRAGLHVHFSNEQTIEIKAYDTSGKPVTHTRVVSGFMDMAKIIHKMDTAFAKEISDARRIPGMYELKPYGFEYRSLPADIDVRKVAEVIKTINA